MSAVAYTGTCSALLLTPWQYSGNVYDNSPAGTTTLPLGDGNGKPD